MIARYFMKRRLCRLAAATLLMLGGAPDVRAEFEVSGDLIGYGDECPITFARLQIRNRTGDTIRYEATFTGGDRMSSEVTVGPFEIEPDGERALDVALPMLQYPSVEVVANGRSIRPNLNRPAYQGIQFLNIAELTKWASEKELDELSRHYEGNAGTHHSGGGPVSSASNRFVGQLEPNRLPDNWLCYAPFRAVFCHEAAWDRMPGAARSAMTKWVDSGGSLLIYGSGKEETVKQMNGSVRYQSRSPFTFAAHEIPADWRRVRPPWQANNQWQHSTGSAAEDRSFPYRVREMRGRAGAFALATAFLVLAGPANFFYFRRKGRLRKLMISLPAISLAFCVLIMIYFVATQGFSRRGGSFALSLLDESRGAAMSYGRHSVFSGLYPLGGFKFGQETAFVPLRKADEFRMALGPVTHLQSGIFQPTANFHYQTAAPRQTREKLIYDAAAQSVINGFEQPVELLVLGDGQTWYSARNVGPGAKAKLERIPPERMKLALGTGAAHLLNALMNEATGWTEEEKKFLLGPMSAFAAAPLPEKVRYAVSFGGTDEEAMQTGLKIDEPGSKHVLISVANTTSAEEPTSGSTAAKETDAHGAI